MTDKVLKVGVVGLGFGASVHVPAFRNISGCRVVAICGTQEEKTKATAQKLGIPKFYTDWKKLISDPEIDAVSVVTPPKVQVQIAQAALECQKHVLCEKPLATTEDEARVLFEVASKNNKAHMIDFEFQETPSWKKAKEYIQQNKIGQLRHALLHWSLETVAVKKGLTDSWKINIENGGGILNNFASHAFYNIEWLLGPISNLDCRIHKPQHMKGSGDTAVFMNLMLSSEMPVSVNISSQSFLGSGHRVEIFGDQGTLILSNTTDDYMNGFELFYGNRETGKLEKIVSAIDSKIDGRIAAVQSLIEKFVVWANSGIKAMPSFESGYRVQKLLSAARRADETGTRVNV